jgi:hypothetical protein
MTGEAPSLLQPDTDYLLDKDKAAMGSVLTAYQGGDPLVDPPAFGYPESMQVEIERRLILEGDRTRKMNEGVFLNPESGWGQIKGFMDGVFEKYKAQNEDRVIKVPKNEQEAIAQMQQMRPVQVDPNEVAAMRQMAVKLDQQMKAIDPRTSFWTDPRTKNYADWLNRESGPGTAGFMESGEQPVEMGAVGRTAYAAWQGIEGIASAPTAIVHGLWDLGRKSISAMGGPDIGPSYPTNYIETEDGQLVSNGGKAPSILDGITMAWAYAANENIEKFAANAGRAQEWELANRAGLGGLTTSVSRLGGELVGLAPGFGAAARVGELTLGKLTQKGLQSLGTLRLAKGAQQSERALKIIGAMSKGMGQASGMAAYESMTQGRVEGYGASYLHGLMMAPVLMTLGALGKKTEWFAANRANMPGAAARAIGGALEGAGFGAVETTIPDLLPSAWGFIRDPNQSTFEAYAKNMLAFSMVKMSTGHTAVASPEQMQIRRGIGRAQFAEKVAQGKATPEELAKAPVANEAKLSELGQMSMRSREGRTPEERTSATKRQREIEQELDVEEFGQKPPAEEAVAEYQGPEKPAARMPTREEIQAVRELPDGPEKRRLTIEMLRDANKAFGRESARTLADVARMEARKAEQDVSDQQEMLEAGHTMRSLMGDQSKTDLRSELKRRLREQGIELGDKDIPAEAGKKKPAEGEDAELEAMAKKLGMSLDDLRREMGEEQAVTPVTDRPARPAAELVPGKEPRVVREEITPAEQAARDEKRIRTSPDPLEDPRFRDLDPAVQEQILAAPDAMVRKRLFAAAATERRNVPRETSEPTELEARRGDARDAAGARMGPQSLQAQPHRQIEPEQGVQQVSARDIFTEMGGRPGNKGFRIPFTSTRVGGTPPDVVRVAIGAGKIAGRRVLGVFKSFENLMRTKEGRDLAVGAHEWSHAMHRHTSNARGGKAFTREAKRQVASALSGPDGPAIWHEMQQTLKDYPGAENMPRWLQWMETWAEWHARNLLGEVGLDAKLPAVSRYMRTWLADPGQAALRGQYERLQQMLYRYNAQGSEGRLRQSRVSGAAKPTETEQATKPGPFRRALTALNKSLLDDMADLKTSQDKWLEAAGRRPEDVSITEDPARMFDALRMTSDKTVEHYVNNGIRMADGTKVPGLKSIMDAVAGRTEEFQDFVVAVRSMELYRKGKEVQLPVQDYVESVKNLTTRNPDFADQLSNLKRWTDALVDYVAGAGNISAEDAKKIKDAYVVYVPFFRAIEGPAQHGQGRGVAERGTGMSRIKGSTFEIQDPFVALQQVARSMVAKAHQHQVMSALFKMSVGQEAGGLASIVKRTDVPTDHPLRELLDAIERQVQLPGDGQHLLEDVFEALRMADAMNPQTVTTFAQKVIPTGERNVIAFTPRLGDREISELVAQGAHEGYLRSVNNKLQWLEVDTKVYEALMGIDKMPQLPEAMQPVMQWLQAPRDLVRFFATGVAPGFVAANLIRDAMSAPLFDRAGAFRPFGGFVKLIRGAIEYHKGGEMRELYEELGVKTSSFWTEGRQRALIGEETSLWHKAKAMADRVQSWFAHPENYIRMAEFKDTYNRAKEAGKPELEARMEALEAGREITVNFARAGIWARVLNQTIPYFNAGLQGQRKLWGQLTMGGADTKGDETKARVQRGAVLNGIANLTVPATLLWLLNKDEDWYQDLPDWRKVGYFNMKIGDEIVSVPKPFEAGTVFASLPEIMLDHLFGQNPASMKAALSSVAGPYLEVGNLIPAFIKPIAEVAFNQNFFTGRPLTPEWIAKSNPPQEQATFYTTETAKVMSRALGGILTPTEIEALAGGYTAGTTTKAMRLMDEIAGLKDHPGIQLNPFQRFTSQQEHGQSSFVDQLYSLSTRLDQNEETLDPQTQGFKRRVDTAKREISELRKSYRAGSITQAEAERRSYEIARPLIEQEQQRNR